MARYKAIDTSPRFLAVDLEKQLLPGSFEHAVHHLLDHEFDLSLFDTRYRNDQSGACAYRIAVDIDLAKFFDTVNHDVLMNLLARTIRDKALLSLIGRYLRAGVQVGEHIEPSAIGTPQGGGRGVVSPLDAVR